MSQVFNAENQLLPDILKLRSLHSGNRPVHAWSPALFSSKTLVNTTFYFQQSSEFQERAGSSGQNCWQRKVTSYNHLCVLQGYR